MELRRVALHVLGSAADDHRKAIAELFIGRSDEAEARLSRVVRPGAPAAVWNDFAVVLTAKAEAEQDETLIAALAAADRAIDADPTMVAARYNRALIIDELGLRGLAERAYATYLRFDGTSDWAARARERLDSLEQLEKNTTDWRDIEPRLLDAAASADLEPVRSAASYFPQEARATVEREILPRWGAAIARGDSNDARLLLSLSRAVGETLLQTRGEGSVADTVAAIERAAGELDTTTALAAAHIAFGEAFTLNHARETAAAARRFDEARALFDGASPPMALAARLFIASAMIDQGRRTEALQRLRELADDTPQRYGSLRASIHRLLGVIMGFEGFAGEALQQFELARDEHLRFGETKHASDLEARIAAVLGVLGRPAEAWAVYRELFKTIGASGSPRAVQSVLHAATFVALQDQRWDFAHALLNLEVELGPVTPTLYAEALVWRILAAERAAMARTASVQLDAARRSLPSIRDPSFREVAENELRLVEAILLETSAPGRSLQLLNEHLDVAARRGRLAHRAQVLVRRASVFRRLGRNDDAERDLRNAIGLVEERGGTVRHDLVRDTFLGKSDDAYTALADLLDSRGDYAASIDVADRRRARIVVDRTGRASQIGGGAVAAVTSALEPDTAFAIFSVFGDRVVTFVIRDKVLHRFETAVESRRLQESVTRFANRTADGQSDASKDGRWLYDVLLEPARAALAGAQRLVIARDPPLDKVSFAALVQPNGRFLVEDAALTIAPGIGAWAATRTRPPRRSRTVVVGNPRIDRSRYPELPSLESAEREAADIAAMYSDPVLLVKNEATKARIVSAMGQAGVIHFATHAIADPNNPHKSRLLLAPSRAGYDDALTVAEIAAMNLTQVNTVVLAGCTTAAAAQKYGYTQNLSAAFLVAGAKHVVASLWDVGDTAGRVFSVALHRALRSGLEPDMATRDAQLHLLRSVREELHSPAAWASMQVESVN